MSSEASQVAIVQWYIPEYRVAFYERLRARLTESNISLSLYYGKPPQGQLQRADAVELAWATPLRTFTRSVGHRSLDYRRLPAAVRGSDLVIVEQALKNIETYPLLALQAVKGTPRVAMWGHGETLTKRVSRAEVRGKRWLTRQANWFFAYTSSGARAAISSGVPPNRVTVVNNSLDTQAISQEIAHLTSADEDSYRQLHGLIGKRVGIYIGGLDETKRVDFLFECAEEVYGRDQSFVLVVAGEGSLRGEVERRLSEPWLKYVGRVGPREKAILASMGVALLIPGAVGLVAIDSFVMGIPIVTTWNAFHGPEFEYLTHKENALITANRSDDYAHAISQLISSKSEQARLKAGCDNSAKRYRLEDMVENFATGIEQSIGLRTP